MAIVTNNINKKVRGATITTITNSDGSTITFKSKLEATIYKALLELQEKDSNIQDIQYEPTKYTLWEGFKPTLPYYVKDKHTGKLVDKTTKIISIHYSPDLVFYYKNNIVFIEIKPQFENDVFYIKEKLFRKYLEDAYNEGNTAYFPIYAKIGTKRNLVELIEIIKEKYGQ